MLELKVMFGAVTPLARTSEIEADEAMVTELLPVTEPPSDTVVPPAVLADKVTSYPEIAPFVEMLPAGVLRLKVLPAAVPDWLALRVMVPALMSIRLTNPPVLALSVLVATEPATILPVADTKLIVPPDRVPPDWEMLPVPVAVSVRVLVAVTLAPKAMPPLAAVDCIVRFVVEDRTPVVLRLPAADKVSGPAVAANPDELRSVELLIVPEPTVPDTARALPELVTVAPPVLFRTMALA